MKPIGVELPTRMQKLEKDHRGYPVPFIVLRDKAGEPHFTINDDRKLFYVLEHDLCGICGQKLLRGRWFVGGPLSAFHPQGAYLDGPLHHECMTYALQVCPYLVASKYLKRVDVATLKAEEREMILIDPTALPYRPKVFVAVMAVGQTVLVSPPQPKYKPNRPYRAVEFWLNGKQISKDQGAQIVADVLQEPFELQEPRVIS
jgi:hypothetical protein